jgi:glycine oxidase
VEVVEHRWGVRPTARDRRPLLGPIEANGRIAVMNGLGARGVLLAPWCADHLLDHLFNGRSLDPEVNVLRSV